MADIRKRAIEGLEVGDTFSVSRIFSKKDVIQFADISGDYNPVHFDEHFASIKNFNSCICHGLLVGSLLTEIGGQIGWLNKPGHDGMTYRSSRFWPGITVLLFPAFLHLAPPDGDLRTDWNLLGATTVRQQVHIRDCAVQWITFPAFRLTSAFKSGLKKKFTLTFPGESPA